MRLLQFVTGFPVVCSHLSARAIADTVLPGYDLGGRARCVLLQCSVNDTYRVDVADRRYVLRAYRHGMRSEADIDFELATLLHLQAHGAAVSTPIARADGALTTVVRAPEGERHLVLFSFAPGQAVQLTLDDRTAFLAGGALAAVHRAGDSFAYGHDRRHDFDYLLDRPRAAIRAVLRPGDDEAARFVERTAERLRGVLADPVTAVLDHGLCHGDAHPVNMHIDDARVTLFDFDSCAVGCRAYDLATFRVALRQSRREHLWGAVLDGYRAVRPLDEGTVRAVPTFILVRTFWLAGAFAALIEQLGVAGVVGRVYQALHLLRRWEAEIDGIATEVAAQEGSTHHDSDHREK